MELRIEDCDDAAFKLIAPRLRVEDQTEWKLSAGDTPAGLYASGSYRLPEGTGTLNRVAYDPTSGHAICVWGVSPAYTKKDSYYHDRIGWVWLVATPEAVPLARQLHKRLDKEFGRIKAMYPTLLTASYIKNPVHHVWLRWLGFTEQGTRKLVTPMGGVFQPFIYKE